MANLRKEARGRECTVRIPGVCNGNSETVILAHLRMAGLTGVGMKADDLFGAWCCSSCHDAIDRRNRTVDAEYAHTLHLEGIIRTQAVLISEGKLKA